jgi:hypothetical protein
MSILRRITGIPGLLVLAVGFMVLAYAFAYVEAPSSTDKGVGELFVIAVIAPILLVRARLKLDGHDPLRLYAGDDAYVLGHSTGIVEGAGKMATVDVHGGGGVISGPSIYTDAMGNVSGGGGGGVIKPIETTTTIHDQFFVRQSERPLSSSRTGMSPLLTGT